MTLIISSSVQAVQLDSTTTHYEEFLPGQSHKFLMDYGSNSAKYINIYSDSIERTKGNMTITFRDISADKKADPLLVYHLRRDS